MSYNDLINIEELWNKLEQFNPERGEVSFYCKNCKKLVEVDRPKPKAYIFVCKTCWKKDIVLGTKEWLKINYKIK
jgi:hypothetical protein